MDIVINVLIGAVIIAVFFGIIILVGKKFTHLFKE